MGIAASLAIKPKAPPRNPSEGAGTPKTRQPLEARRSAQARPMPEVAPVIKTTLAGDAGSATEISSVWDIREPRPNNPCDRRAIVNERAVCRAGPESINMRSRSTPFHYSSD